MNIMDLAANFAADPRFRLAYQGPAGETAPAMRMQGGAQGYVEPAPPPMAVPVPGQNAQAVMPAPTPDQRIGGAFEAAGQNQAPQIPPEILAAALARAGGGNAQAPVAPPITPPTIAGGASGGGGWVGDMMGAIGAEPEAGPLGRFLPAAIRNPLADAMMGLAGGDPTAPPLQAFGQGFVGASAGRSAREDRKRAEQAATQEQAWKMEDRTLGREDRTYERGRDVVADEREMRKEERDERKALFDEISDAAGIEHTRAQTAKIERELSKSGLTLDEQLKIQSEVTDLMKTMIGDYPTPELIAEATTAGDILRTKLIGERASAAPDATTDVEVNGVSGKGSYDSPLTGGAAAVNRALDEAAPGTTVYFLDETGTLRAEER